MITVRIKSDKHRLFIPIPVRLALNSLTARLIEKHSGISITRNQRREFRRAVHQSKKLLHGAPLIEVHSKENDDVVIKL